MTSFTPHLDAEITRAKRAHAERITKLKRAAAAEQRRIDDRVVILLQEKDPEQYVHLAAQVVKALAAEKLERSNRARRYRRADQRVPSDAEQSGAGLCVEGGGADDDQ